MFCLHHGRECITPQLLQLHADLFSRHASPLKLYVLWRWTKEVKMLCTTRLFVVDATENSTAVWPRIWVTKKEGAGEVRGAKITLLVDEMGVRKENKNGTRKHAHRHHHHHHLIIAMAPSLPWHHAIVLRTNDQMQNYATSSSIQRGSSSKLNQGAPTGLGCG